MNDKQKLFYARWQNELPALLAILLFFVAFFGWIWTNGVYLVGGDAFSYSYPLRTVAWRMIRHGELPLWTPLILSGYPLLSMAQVALGYPVTWLYLFLPGHIAEEVFVLSPFVMAPLFTYIYAREIGRSRLAALLAGLSYGYGGMTTGLLGVVGIMPHALLWLPLMLVALERARTRRFIPCLLGATVAFGFSVLTGLGQGFLFVGLVALLYSFFLMFGVSSLKANHETTPPAVLDRARPFAVCLIACTLGSAVGAWQILESLRAARRSIRSTLIYPFFVSGSFTPMVALKSLVAPLYTERFADVTTYVAPLTLLLATWACLNVLRRRTNVPKRDPRIAFWGVIGVVAFVFILGSNTPVYPLLYHVPIFKLFRVPSRHTFEWTFAVSILAGYGWDALRTSQVQKLTQAQRSSKERVLLIVAVGLLILSAVLGLAWARATGVSGLFAFNRSEGAPSAWAAGAWYSGLPLSRYLLWKIGFTATILAALWCGWQLSASSRRAFLLTATLLLVCFVEPFIVVRNWWQPFAKTAERFHTPSIATSWLKANIVTGARIYPRVDLFADEFTEAPRVDPPNLTMLYNLPSVAGYEPLLLERYSRALGNVHLDAVSPLPGFSETNELFTAQSHVLDLLSMQYVVTHERNAAHTGSNTTVDKDGLKFSTRDLLVELRDSESTALSGPPENYDTLALVTSLANSINLTDGTPIARVRVLASNHHNIEFTLRAGLDTAEWAHERPDVRGMVKHKLAPVFDSTTLNEGGTSYPGHRYWIQLPLGTRSRVERIEIAAIDQHAPLAVWKVTLFDSVNRRSFPLGHSPGDLLPRIDAQRWQRVLDRDDVFIFENRRALPHAWLVAEAISVDGEEALRQVRGDGSNQFDPQRTALLEVPPGELPQLPGGTLAATSKVQVTSYQANSLSLETDAPTPTVLVVSEIFYPGWEATVDGRPVRILLSDYLLRGISLPAGKHRVEMRYRAPAACIGLTISALTLSLLCLVALYARRQR